MLPIVLGLIGLVIDVVLVVAIHSFTSFDLSSFSLFYIVPVGAIITGALASLGYYFGILKSNLKASKTVRSIGFIITLVGFVAIQYGFYHTAYMDENNDLNFKMKGEHISNVIGDPEEPINFISFTKEMVNSRVISFSNRGRALFDIEGVKVVNWIFYLLDFVGMLAGSFIARMVVIGDKKYCDNCKRYMKDKKFGMFSTSNYERLDRMKAITYANPDEIAAPFQDDGCAINSEHYDVYLHWCTTCNSGYLQLQYMELNSKNNLSNNEAKNIEIPINSSITQMVKQFS